MGKDARESIHLMVVQCLTLMPIAATLRPSTQTPVKPGMRYRASNLKALYSSIFDLCSVISK
jgi:hypothetical protein